MKNLKEGWYVGRIEGPGYPEGVQDILDEAGLDRPPREIFVMIEAWNSERLGDTFLHVNGILVANDWRIKNSVEIVAGPYTEGEIASILLQHEEAKQAQAEEPGPDNTEENPPGKEQ